MGLRLGQADDVAGLGDVEVLEVGAGLPGGHGEQPRAVVRAGPDHGRGRVPVEVLPGRRRRVHDHRRRGEQGPVRQGDGQCRGGRVDQHPALVDRLVEQVGPESDRVTNIHCHHATPDPEYGPWLLLPGLASGP